jgi:hypothetical protein
MRRQLMVLAVGSVLILSSGRARAQVMIGGPMAPYRVNGAIGMPDVYGTSWGVASFGIPRTYTTFSSPYGAGYGYGYPAPGVLPGKFGVGLWRPGFVAPGYTYGSAYGYNTFPYPYKPGGPMYGPSIGVYAPGFGPGGQPPSFYAR